MSADQNGQHNAQQSSSDSSNEKKPEPPKAEKQPAGGYDSTPIPKAPPGYTVKITFHSATNLPMADINTLSSDPYVLAQLNTGLATRHKEDPNLRFRTKTIRRQTDPVWNCDWIVANVPASGFKLKARIYDEDPADHDDRLGNVHIPVDGIDERWSGIREQTFKLKKRMGSKRAYFIRGCAAIFTSGVEMSGVLTVSVQVLGRTEGDGGRAYTVGPNYWVQHFSPMIGRITGTKDPKKGEGGTARYNFQANQFQLTGPVPSDLYHRYVEFKPFVRGMFTTTGIRGKILSHALHHQHARVYNFDRDTVYGMFDHPSTDMTSQFLDLVHYDQGGRIYTYVLTLDALFRFTETGKEFGIDMLSKHTMHSDVSIYIAFSGEFFIRRLKHPHKSAQEQETHPPAEVEGGPPSSDPPKDPAYYELIIDNDSGTYRPNAKLLPKLKAFFQSNFPGLKITTLDCQGDAERMNKLKTEQRERKKAEGNQMSYVQADDSSISSSDEEDLEDQSMGKRKSGKRQIEMNAVTKPVDKVRGWAHGDKKREVVETGDGEAVTRPGPS